MMEREERKPGQFLMNIRNVSSMGFIVTEVKACEESASQQLDVSKLTPPSQESSTNQSQFPRLSTSSSNLSTASTQSISGSGSIHTPLQSEIAYNTIMRY